MKPGKLSYNILGILVIFVLIIGGVLLYQWFASDEYKPEVHGESEKESLLDENATYGDDLKAIVQDHKFSCEDYKESAGAPLKAYLEENLSVCQEFETEECEKDYYLYKMVAEDFTNCDAIEKPDEKEMCKIIQQKEAEKCSRMEEYFQEPEMSEESCLSIVKNDISECEGLEPYAKRGCWFGYYLHKALINGAEECENLKDFPTGEAVNKADFKVKNYFDFSPVHLQDLTHLCKAFAKENYSIYENYFEEKCELDTVVARVTLKACEEEVEAGLQDECKDRIKNLVDCLDSDKTLEDKKACVNEYTNIDTFCGDHYAKDAVTVKNSVEESLEIQPDSENRPLQRVDLIKMEPELCEI